MPVADPKRIARFSWQILKINNNWVLTNTGTPVILAFDGLLKNEIPRLENYRRITSEVVFGDSRYDTFAIPGKEKCCEEV